MKTMRFLLTLALVASMSVSCSGQKKQQNAVKKSFTNYKQAILNGDGQEAIKWVDKNTLDYYDRMLELSKTGDSATISNLRLIDKLTVLMVRHRIPTSDVYAMDGNSFFVYAIDNGMVGKNSVMNVELGEIKIEGTFATGQIVSNGQTAPFGFHFHNENDRWKIDLTSIFTVSTAGLKKVISDIGMTDTEWIFQSLEMLTGKQPVISVWQPLKR